MHELVTRPILAAMSSSQTVAPREGMSICGACGVIAPSNVDKCDACKAALSPGGQPTVPDREDGRYWLQVRAQYNCKHCERRSPVNHVDVDGSFTCLRCQADQRADAGIWAIGLRFCHEVGDLAGPNPEGRHPDPEVQIGESNKWADIGVSRTRAHMEFSETVMGGGKIKLRSLFMDARPGVPLCSGCHAPLSVVVTEPCKLEARCDACSETALYEVHGKAHRMHRPFVGVLADDHRADRPVAKIGAKKEGAPVAIECPGCGAPLDLNVEDHFVTCAFCSTPSKIPSRHRAQLFEGGVELEPFWLLFEGPSKARDKLVKKAVAARNKAAKQRGRADNRRRSAEDDDRAKRKAEEAAKSRNKQASIGVLLVLLVVLGYLLLR
jgi:hypothetical protein